jgi:uncharacterized protein
VLNVVDFGAFVDVGLKESGLVHVSQLSSQFITSPHDVVSVGDVVTVWVLSVDAERKRVSLGMIKPGTATAKSRRPEQKSDARSTSQGTPASSADKPPLGVPAGSNDCASAAPTPKPVAPPPPKHQQPAKRPEPAQTERKQPPAPPLSAGAQTGEEPLRSFGQLKQFWNKKTP